MPVDRAAVVLEAKTDLSFLKTAFHGIVSYICIHKAQKNTSSSAYLRTTKPSLPCFRRRGVTLSSSSRLCAAHVTCAWAMTDGGRERIYSHHAEPAEFFP